MDNKFEKLTTGVARIYKSIQKIKKHHMNSLGLKGTHVMCIYFLASNPKGLTAADLCNICQEDKAGISRILSDLEANGYICYNTPPDTKRYRARAILTKKGLNCSSKVNSLIENAVKEGGQNISDKDREIFYRTLFTIADNLNKVCETLYETKSRKDSII